MFSRTIATSNRAQSRNGLFRPGSNRTGRRLTYWLKARRIGMSRPHSETWSGTPGQPTAPRKIASVSRSWSIPSGGIIAPWSAYQAQLHGTSHQFSVKPCREATASSTRRAAGTTSLPMPSPGIAAMRYPHVPSFVEGVTRRTVLSIPSLRSVMRRPPAPV